MKTQKPIPLLLCIFAIFCGTNISSAQTNFIPGYIIESSGNKTNCLIDFRDWSTNPSEVDTRTSSEGTTRNYTPSEIKEFGVEGRKFVRANFEVMYNLRKGSGATKDSIVHLKRLDGFMEVLIDGEKVLGYWKGSDGVENYYTRNASNYDLLIYKKYLRKTGASDIALENKKYVGQLSRYLSDCGNLRDQLSDVEYKRGSLMDLYTAYYDCRGTKISFQKSPEKTRAEIGVLAGVTMSSIEFSGSGFEFLANADYNTSTAFSGGLFLDLVFPKQQGKWSINNELIYTSFDFEGESRETISENNFSVTNTAFQYAYIKLNNMLRFNYPIGGARIFINAGISNGFAISETQEKEKLIVIGPTEMTETGPALSETRKYEQGFLAGAGVKINALSLQFRYEGGGGMSPFSGLKSNTSRLYFLAGYRIK